MIVGVDLSEQSKRLQKREKGCINYHEGVICMQKINIYLIYVINIK